MKTNKRTLDFIPMNFINNYYNCNHVHVSDRLVVNSNGTFDITTYHSDYKALQPNAVKIHFDQNKHRFLVHRYMKYAYFKEEIQNNILTFISPLLWKDPYETIFFEKNKIIKGDTYNLWCICSAYDSVSNEESAWLRSNFNNVSNDVNDKIIRVSYTFDKLCQVLENISNYSKNQVEFYISIIDYSQSKDTLIKKKGMPINTIDDYLNLLSLKRKAFFYENELRLFAVTKTPAFNNKTNGEIDDIFKANYNVNCSCSLSDAIFSVTMPPMEPFKRTDARFSEYAKFQDLYNLDLRIQLIKLIQDTRKIQQSRLYTSETDTKWIGNLVNNYSKSGKIII